MVADGNITSGFFGATASNSPSGIVNNYGVEVGMNVGKQMKDFFLMSMLNWHSLETRL